MSRAARAPETADSRNEWLRCPEARLWRVVVQRAILDAFAAPGKGGATVSDTVEAQQWLAGGRRDLRLVCDFAGIDADMIHSWAIEMARDGWPRHRFEVWKQIARGLENERAAA
jgi:hypothetical protein